MRKSLSTVFVGALFVGLVLSAFNQNARAQESGKTQTGAEPKQKAFQATVPPPLHAIEERKDHTPTKADWERAFRDFVLIRSKDMSPEDRRALVKQLVEALPASALATPGKATVGKQEQNSKDAQYEPTEEDWKLLQPEIEKFARVLAERLDSERRKTSGEALSRQTAPGNVQSTPGAPARPLGTPAQPPETQPAPDAPVDSIWFVLQVGAVVVLLLAIGFGVGVFLMHQNQKELQRRIEKLEQNQRA